MNGKKKDDKNYIGYTNQTEAIGRWESPDQLTRF
jgi:hypothetical protein